MRPILIVLHRLGSGGVTQAVLDQARMFSEAGRDVAIATLDDNPHFAASIEDLRNSGRLAASVPVHNIYDDSARAAGDARPARRAMSKARRTLGRLAEPLAQVRTSQDLIETGTDAHGAYRRHFTAAGEYYAFDRLDEDGGIKHTNFFENRFLIRRDEMAGEHVARRTWFTTDGGANRVEFLTAEGFIYAQRWMNPENGRGVGVYVAEPSTRRMRRFNGLPDWHVAWLQDLVDRSSTAPYVIAETASTIAKTLRLRRSSAVRIAMMHNSQVGEPFAVDSPLRTDYDDVFAQLDQLDAFVVLSERQRADMAERLGNEDGFTVVPNALRLPPRPDVERDPRLVSVVSRLAPQKALHEAIHAFSHVLEDVPDARLEIYGRGPSKKELEDLVAELGLSGSIRFMGRTSEPNAAMARSVCTVSTSDWEALPLSIAESLAVGTPVVSYDCLYGPSTLIRDGETGIIVPRGAREQLAEGVVRLLHSPSETNAMGTAGRADISSRLSFETVLREWDDTFRHADRRSGLRSPR